MLTRLFCCLAWMPYAAAAADKLPLPEVPADQKQELLQYLQANWKSPEQYVISKFADHDILFLGEYHRIKHDTLLVQSLIPLLYQAGVYNLGIEFTASESQADVDALLSAPTYHEARVRKLFSGVKGESGLWPYTEYMDIYRRAWELNQSLPPDAPRFHVVGLTYAADFSALQTGTLSTASPDVLRAVWFQGDPDVHMANVILSEFVAKGQKALIYSGFIHAFTRYRQPALDPATGTVARLINTRMGNVVYGQIGERAFTISLHAPWEQKDGVSYSYAAAGVIDSVMREFSDTRVGFDLAGTPFGALHDPNTFWAYGYNNFSLSDFADGYIYQKALSNYEGVTADPNVVTWDNLADVLANFPVPALRTALKTPDAVTATFAQDADIQHRFQKFQ